MDAESRYGSGTVREWEFGISQNGRKDLVLSFNLVCGNRSPNRDQELSAGELNRWEKKKWEK